MIYGDFCNGGLMHIRHNCMAIADRAVVVFVKEFHRDHRPQSLLDDLIQH